MAETTPTKNSKSVNKGASKALLPELGPKKFDLQTDGGIKKHGWSFLFFGVILPTVAIIFETNFHFCASHFFDPFPSGWHVVLFSLIPFSNYLVWLSTRRDLSSHYAFMSLLTGMAMGVGCLYSLMFLPLTPMACLFTLALGFGLLGLAPLLSLPCNWIAGKTVCHLAARKITYFNPHQFEHIGHMIILVMVIAIELPSTMTRVNLSRSISPNTSEAADSVRWLRRYGSEEVLLRACYERSGRATDILGSLYESAHPLNVDQARRVFYQVTGKPFNAVAIPRSARATIQHTGAAADLVTVNAGPNAHINAGLNAGVDDEFDLDTDIAGEAVSGVARGLTLSQSTIQGSLGANEALGSLLWSFVFTNDSKFDREARAKILLPPQAVITRATLIVNDVEHDAKIMVRGAARARYRQSVVEHNDPLLVSTCGTDQILVQCFPVRPGQKMKVRLQVTVPLVLDQEAKGTMMLPAFMERNFQLVGGNQVSLDCTGPISAPGLSSGPAPEGYNYGAFFVSGNLDASQLTGFKSIVRVDRDQSINSVWCKTLYSAKWTGVQRQLEMPRYDNIKKLVVLIDGSLSMQQFCSQIEAALKSIAPGRFVQVTIAGDKVFDICPPGSVSGGAAYLSGLERLKSYKFEGGVDDSEALSQALTQSHKNDDSGIVWIHTAQPMSTGSASAVKAALDRAGSRPLLFDMQLAAGPNEILSGLIDHQACVRVTRTGSVSSDIATLIASISPDATAPSAPQASTVGCQQVGQYRLYSEMPEIPAGLEADNRLAQIAANRLICMDMQEASYVHAAEAADLARTFQIVSPVSSAVVAEDLPALATAPPSALQGQTNGILAKQKDNYFLRFPTAAQAGQVAADRPVSTNSQPASTDSSSDAFSSLGSDDVQVGTDKTAAPTAKIVPEADTALLLLVVLILFSSIWFVRHRRVGKA